MDNIVFKNNESKHCWITRYAKVAEIKLFAGTTIALEAEMLIFSSVWNSEFKVWKAVVKGELKYNT